MRRFFYVALVTVVALSGACSDESGNNGNSGIVDTNNVADTGNNSTTEDMGGETSEDMGGETSEDMGTNQDMGGGEEIDLNVANPGFMNGVWALETGGGDNTPFTFRIRHDLDDEENPLIGSYTETATTLKGLVQPPQFSDEPFGFTMNWFLNDGVEMYSFGVSQSTQLDEDRIQVRYNNGRLVEVTDAVLVRQE